MRSRSSGAREVVSSTWESQHTRYVRHSSGLSFENSVATRLRRKMDAVLPPKE